MSEYNLGTARGKIELDASQVSKGAQDAKSSIQDMKGEIERSGGMFRSLGDSLDTLGGRIVSVFTTGAKVVTGAIAAMTAGAVWKGLNRVLDTEDARVQMERMGVSISDVDKLLAAVDDTFNGTPFANPDGFNISSQLYASNVELDRIPGILSSVADFAAHANVPIDRMGDMFVRIASQGRVTGQELMSLAQMGIPIATLADSMGMTVDQLREMTSNGEFTSEMFMEAAGSIEMFEGAAKAMGTTTRGAFSNVLTALGVLGEKLIGPLFGQNGYAVQAMQALREAIRGLFPAAEAAGEALAAWLIPAIERAVHWLQNEFVPAVQRVIDVIQDIVGWIRENEETIRRLIAAMGPAAAIIGAVATSVHLLRKAWVLLQAATPIGLLFLLVSALVYAYQNSETFRNIVNAAFEMVRDTISAVVEFLQPYIERVIGWFQGSGDSAQSMSDRVKAAWEAIKSAVEPVIDWFRTHVGPVFEALGELASAVWDRMKAQWEAMLALIKAVWDRYGADIKRAWDIVWNQIKNVFELVWNAIKTIVETALGIIKGVIQVVTGAISGDWSKVWEGIKTIFSSIWEGIKKTVDAAIKFVKGTIENYTELIMGIWSRVWDTVLGKLKEVWEGIKSGVQSGIRSVMEFVRGLKDDILGFFGDAASWLRDAGSRLISGLADGIREGFSKAREAMSNGLSNLRGMLPFSPAKEGPFSGRGWTLFSGQSMIRGLAEGIRKQEEKAVQAALSVANSVSDVLSDPAIASSIGSTSNDLIGASSGRMSAVAASPSSTSNSYSAPVQMTVINPDNAELMRATEKALRIASSRWEVR